MKKLFVAFLTCTVAITLLSCASTKPAEKPGVIAVAVSGWTATVKSVDYANKTVVLERDGKTVTVDASYAKRLDEIKPGDVVKAERVEEVAIYVREAEAGPMASAGQTVELAPMSQGPGGIATETKRVVANVAAVDYQNRTITLEMNDGTGTTLKTFKVSDAVQRFDQIRKGDQVVLQVTDAIMINVVKP
ncbi:MAG: hypothetical protein ACXWMI_04755 [Syntrophales bacterium]